MKNKNDLKGLDSQKDAENLVSTIIGSSDKNRHLHFHGRGVSSTKLKQKALMNELEKKHAEEIEAMEKKYEDMRQQDRGEIANGLRSFFSQFQQQNPQMSLDLSMFGTLLHDVQPESHFRLQSSTSASKV